MFVCISLKCWDGQHCRDALQRITIQCDRGTRHCARERLVRHIASYTVTTMNKTLCKRGVTQRNTLRRHVWDETNRVERVHCASERLGRSNTDFNNTVWARYTTWCEVESGTVQVSRQTQCERRSILVVRRTEYFKATHDGFVEVHQTHCVCGTTWRNPLVYILVWTQSRILFAGNTEYTYVYHLRVMCS